MSKLRSVSTAFWSDPFIEELSPNEKLLFLYLITNEKTNMLGIYESSVKKISFETGLTKEEVFNALKRFETLKKVKYINNFVVLINYMKHQNFNTNMKKSAIDTYNKLPKELKDNKLSIDKSNVEKGFESLSKHFGMVRKVEYEVKDELEDEYKLNISYTDFLELNYKTSYDSLIMKLVNIDKKEFLEFFNNKCVMEDVPFEYRKIEARFNLLKSNWNKGKEKSFDKKEKPKTLQEKYAHLMPKNDE